VGRTVWFSIIRSPMINVKLPKQRVTHSLPPNVCNSPSVRLLPLFSPSFYIYSFTHSYPHTTLAHFTTPIKSLTVTKPYSTSSQAPRIFLVMRSIRPNCSTQVPFFIDALTDQSPLILGELPADLNALGLLLEPR
jgi:hypothetical protein